MKQKSRESKNEALKKLSDMPAKDVAIIFGILRDMRDKDQRKTREETHAIQ